ncbi:MAG: nitrilase-related carbon-nitrogen hydrolase [Pseudomonadota bacterium]|nr:nitrilase-related carbon-nitrogen hydrolase [Pseudomonadota bacterium]
MIDPYIAVALQTSVQHVVKRSEVELNLNHIGDMIDLVTHICSLELPVRLICFGEGAIQGFVDEILNLSPAEYADTMAAEIPGWETEYLGEKAKEKGCFIMGQLKVKLPEFPDRFFNAIFIIDPNGEIIYTHYKNIVLFVEHSSTPHDVYDEWVKLHGDGIDTFFPVAETEIGNIAGSVGVEGAFPESYRGFALNGAEILYRSALPEPWVSREIYTVQNRARAMDNTAYMVAPNTGSLIFPGDGKKPSSTIDGALGGHSAVIDYKGHVLAQNTIPGDTYIAGEINIDALRHFRENAKFQNWIPYIRSEIFKGLYEKPIWPKNLPNMQHEDAEVVFNDVIKELQKRGSYKKR